MRRRGGRMRFGVVLAAVAAPVLLANVASAVEVPNVEVTVPPVPVTVPAVDVTVPPVTVPELPVSIPPIPVTVPEVTAPAATVTVPAATPAPASPTSAAEPATAELIPAASTARVIPRPPVPTLAAAARQAAEPFAIPLGAMALIAVYVVLRGALDRRDLRLASAHTTDRWVGFE